MADSGELNVIKSLYNDWVKVNDGIAEEVMKKWWEVIKCKYSEPTRKYHRLSHLHRMFDHMETHKQYIEMPKAVSYAIFFHDLQYDPKSQENEEESVEHFTNFAKEAGLSEDAEFMNKVTELIQLTKTHCTEEHKNEEQYGKEDKHFFLDFDVSILGSSPEEYKEYAEQIREEYKFLPDDTYNYLRAKVLKSFLQIPNIFATHPFREQYEQQARTNIQQEIMKLELLSA